MGSEEATDASPDAGIDAGPEGGTGDAGPSAATDAGACVATTGPGIWTWMGGGAVSLGHGVYGTQSLTDPASVPGARRYATSWVDSHGAFWLFGGWGYGTSGQAGYLDDLWKFDGKEWTWVAGSQVTDQHGVYGDGGGPGARELAASWVDGAGGLWLFGGFGFGKSGQAGYLGDLWKFDGKEWTWVGGADMTDQLGHYDEGGGRPGARTSPMTWADSSGAWLFGGRGYGVGSDVGDLNDLWRLEGGTWTWMGGGTTASDALGLYGTKGVAAAGNLPGGLQLSASWTQGGSVLWLFGGDEAGLEGSTNDLWKFDGTNWTWVTGTGTTTPGEYATGTYGARGMADPENSPGSRRASISWADRCGNLWLAGGYGWGSSPGSTNGPGPLNDVWRFDGTNWAWMTGARFIDQPGVYTDAGVGTVENFPGGRYGAAWWADPHGGVWVFGGIGIDSAGAQGELNDLWRYQP